MAKVTLKANETVDNLLKRFKTIVKKDGILEECRKRESFTKKSKARKEKSIAARRKEKFGY